MTMLADPTGLADRHADPAENILIPVRCAHEKTWPSAGAGRFADEAGQTSYVFGLLVGW